MRRKRGWFTAPTMLIVHGREALLPHVDRDPQRNPAPGSSGGGVGNATAGRRTAAFSAARVPPAGPRSSFLPRHPVVVPPARPWSSFLRQIDCLDDVDAVSVGDLPPPDDVALRLAGERRVDDARKLMLLEPWPGHRGRLLHRLVPAPPPGYRLHKLAADGLRGREPGEQASSVGGPEPLPCERRSSGPTGSAAAKRDRGRTCGCRSVGSAHCHRCS